jgi:hypothetical protein
MKITDIKTEPNKVIFKLESYDGEHIVEFTKRYLIDTQDRWNFELEEIIRYFLNIAPKGSIIGSGEDFVTTSNKKGYHYTNPITNVLIWDLKKIYPQIDFIENDNLEEEIFEKL